MVKTIALVSLSSGLLGEDFVAHEVALGLTRLKAYGIRVKIMPHAQCGIDHLRAHPEQRAADLLTAMADDEVDMILCAIGGDDGFHLAPALFADDALKNALAHKIFLGFSDTTWHHFMLHKLGLPTFYGQAFIPDLCEMDAAMLPYTAAYFTELISTGRIAEIRPSPVWYEERRDFSPAALGVPRIAHPNDGFHHMQGAPQFRGKILGGCIETIYDMLDGTRYPDSVDICRRYALFPDLADWQDKILLLETSEEQSDPDHYRHMLLRLRETGIFTAVRGILCGKPMDERYADDYEALLREVVADPHLPIVTNLNIGHATPRCILPLGIDATVDAAAQVIRFA